MNEQRAVFIAYNRAHHGIIVDTLQKMNLRGYTEWNDVLGKGSKTGEPHLGSHAWPTVNGAMMVICSEEQSKNLLAALREIDQSVPKLGLRAFTWSVKDSI